jgi:uncharacterized protein (DUF58 family)
MLIPSLHLIRLSAAVLLPAAAVAGLVPGAAGLAVAVIIAFALVAAWDAQRGLGRLDDLELTLPPVLRFTLGHPGTIPVRMRTAHPRARRVEAALSLPGALETETWTQSVQIAATTDPLQFQWRVLPRERGRHRIDWVHVETDSPQSLWAVRRKIPQSTEARIYPDLFRERAAAAVFLNRGGAGIHSQRQIGQGREFEKLRDYTHQDPVGDIHWKATAKRGRPVTKVFQIERTQEVYVVLDASRLSARVSGEESDFERSLRSGLLLAAAAERQGDLFGVVAFDSRVRAWVRSGRGRDHFAACREALFGLQPQRVSPDFTEVCTTLRLRLRRRALLVVLTALDDPVLAEEFSRSIRLLSGHHLVLVVQPRPKGARALFSGSSVVTDDDVYAELGGHVRWQRLRLLEQELRLQNVRFSLAESESLASTVLHQYFAVRQRQLL